MRSEPIRPRGPHQWGGTAARVAFALLLGLAMANAPGRTLCANEGPIQIAEAWARATPTGAKAGAAYMTIENRGRHEDRLTGVTSAAAEHVQIHAMTMDGDVTRMREIAGGVGVPPNGSVALKPGGDHLMLLGLHRPLKAGDTVAVTLNFARAGAVVLDIPVRAGGHAPHSGMDGSSSGAGPR